MGEKGISTSLSGWAVQNAKLAPRMSSKVLILFSCNAWAWGCGAGSDLTELRLGEGFSTLKLQRLPDQGRM